MYHAARIQSNNDLNREADSPSCKYTHDLELCHVAITSPLNNIKLLI